LVEKVAGPVPGGAAAAADRTRRGPNNQSDRAEADARSNSITDRRDLLWRYLTNWIAAVYCARVGGDAAKVSFR
jgi:hypothetical protein